MTQTYTLASARAGTPSVVVTETTTQTYQTNTATLAESQSSSTVLGATYSAPSIGVSAVGNVGTLAYAYDSAVSLTGLVGHTSVGRAYGNFYGLEGEAGLGSIVFPYILALVSSTNSFQISGSHGAGMPSNISQLTLSLWFMSGTELDFTIGSTGFRINVNSDFDGNAQCTITLIHVPGLFGGTSVFSGTYNTSVAWTNSPNSSLMYIAMSFDITAQTMEFYFNDQAISNSGTGWQSNLLIDNTDTNNFGNSQWVISQPNPEFFGGGVGDVWINANFLDLSNVNNRRKFIDADGLPVDLGLNGQLPLGSPPTIFLHVPQYYGAASDIVNNLGSGSSWSASNPLVFSPDANPRVTAVAGEISMTAGDTLNDILPTATARTPTYPVSVTYAVARLPPCGSIVVATDGTFTYTPRSDFVNDDDVFKYSASIPVLWPYSPGIATSTALVKLHVNQANTTARRGVHFDGFAYLFNSVSPTVVGDHPQGTISFWYRAPNQYELYPNADNQFAVILFGSPTLLSSVPEWNYSTRAYVVNLWVADLTSDPSFLTFSDGQASTSNGFTESGILFWPSDGYWHHIMFSWDSSVTEDGPDRFQWMVDGFLPPTTIRTSSGTPDTGTSFAPNWAAMAGLQIGSDGATSNTNKTNTYEFYIAEFYLNIDTKLDLSDPATYAKFVTDNAPADLGTDGSLPTGTAPLIYLTIPDASDDPADFAVNRGVGMVDFTIGGPGPNDTTPASNVTVGYPGTLYFSDRNPTVERPIKYPTGGDVVDITIRTPSFTLSDDVTQNWQLTFVPGNGPATLAGIFPFPDGGDGHTLVGGQFVELLNGTTTVVRNMSPSTADTFPESQWGLQWVDLVSLDYNRNRVARAISRDGLTVVGYSTDGSLSQRAVFWVINPGFTSGTVTDLQPDGFGGDAKAVSADGSVIVGIVYDGSSNAFPFMWTASSLTILPDLAGSTGHPTPYGISDDGTVIVGDSPLDGTTVACRYDAINGWTSLGTLEGGNESHAYGISGDGLTIVGSSTASDGILHAIYWTEVDGMVDLGILYGDTEAYAISDNGIIVGRSALYVSVQGTSYDRAFRWDGTMSDLGLLPYGTYARALDITSDGTMIIGTGDDGSYDFYTFPTRGFVWRQESGMVGLYDFPSINQASEANGISGDGSVIAGTNAYYQNPGISRAATYVTLPPTPDNQGADFGRDDSAIYVAQWPVFPTMNRMPTTSTELSNTPIPIYRPNWLEDSAAGGPPGYVVPLLGSSVVNNGQVFLLEQDIRSGQGITVNGNEYQQVKLWSGFDAFDRAFTYHFVELFADQTDNVNYLFAMADITRGWNCVPFLWAKADATTGVDIARHPIRITDTALDQFLIGEGPDYWPSSVMQCPQGLVILASSNLDSNYHVLVISPDAETYTHYRISPASDDELAIATFNDGRTPSVTIDANGKLWYAAPRYTLTFPQFTNSGFDAQTTSTQTVTPTMPSGAAIGPDYFVSFYVLLSNFNVMPPDGTSLYVIGRANESGFGYVCNFLVADGHFHVQLLVGTTLIGDIDIGVISDLAFGLTVTLLMHGTQISVTMQDGTSNWLNSSGHFQSSEVTAIQTGDASFSDAGSIIYGSVGL